MEKIKRINRANTAIIEKTAILLLLLLVSNVFIVLADDPGAPCGDPIVDPIGDCPLDTWTMYLAIIAVFFAVFYLRKKNNESKSASLIK